MRRSKCVSYAHLRHRAAPETLREVKEFVARRTQEIDRAAICSRYDLIRSADFRETVSHAQVPIYQLCGSVDPIVPWLPVRRWFKRNCPNCLGWRVIWKADHNVLGTAPRASADQIWDWIKSAN